MDYIKCFFIGSRHAPSSIKQQLVEAVEKHINEYGVNSFTVGHYGSFDSLVQSVLSEAKKRHPDIELCLLTPYAFNQQREKPEDFDGTLYPEGLEKVPYRLAIVQANRHMVKTSNYLIAYPGIGNSRNMVEFAQSREKRGLIKVTLLER